MTEIERQHALQTLIRGQAGFYALLQAARAAALPDWWVGAGAIRNLVWDHLHGYARPTPLADVDVIFFDPCDLTPARDRAAGAALQAQRPDVPWEATNQAAVHLWYPDLFGLKVPPFMSSAEAVTTWPETATSVAVRLEAGGALRVEAPCGLADLFDLVLRRNPRRVSRAQFEQRLHDKDILRKWPRVRVIDG